MTGALGSLRAARESDLPFVLKWRNHASIRSMMYTQHVISPSEHKDWWERIKYSDLDRALIFEHSGVCLGVVTFSEIDRSAGTAFWAFYSAPAAPRGTGSLMEYCALEEFFADTRMRKLNCEVLGRNGRVIALHRKFGFEVEGVFAAHKLIDNEYDDVHRLAIFRESWENMRGSTLDRLIDRENQ